MDFRRGREKDGSREVIESPAISGIRGIGDGASAPAIRLGDTVIFFEGREAIGCDRMKHKTIWQCRHGAFHHDDIVGKPFGCRVFSRTTKGHVYALSPTPELWCQVVPSRTQIVQDFDQSIVIFRLDLKPGDVVVESGTGSGVMSTAIMRTIAPTGFLYTFEFNEIRAKMAQEEFQQNQLGELGKVLHRDVCAGKNEGGGFGQELEGKADAVFLDLPEPWLAVPHAKLVLKSGKKIASYSPCIEQVMKTCEALRFEGFHSVTTLECRLRPINYAEVQLDTPDFGSPVVSVAAPPIAASQGQVAASAPSSSEDREVIEIATGTAKESYAGGSNGVEGTTCTPPPQESENGKGMKATDREKSGDDSSRIRVRDKEEAAVDRAVDHAVGIEHAGQRVVNSGVKDTTTAVGDSKDHPVTESAKESKKRARDEPTEGCADTDSTEFGVGRGRNERLQSKAAIRAAEAAAVSGAKPRMLHKLVCAQPFPVMRGHTAFLTFATTPVAPRSGLGLGLGLGLTSPLKRAEVEAKVNIVDSKGGKLNGDSIDDDDQPKSTCVDGDAGDAGARIVRDGGKGLDADDADCKGRIHLAENVEGGHLVHAPDNGALLPPLVPSADRR